MDTKVLIESVAKTLDRQPKDISALLTGMTNVIRDHLSEMDSVAIPGFGEFEPIKHEEEDPARPLNRKIDATSADNNCRIPSKLIIKTQTF